MLKDILNLEGVTELSKTQKSSVKGGYSKLYCLYHSTKIVVFGLVIKDAGSTYEACRKMKD